MAPLSYYLLSSLALLSGVSAIGSNSAVLDLIPANFDKVVLESNKPALVEFFAPWCGHCKNLAPVYEELAQALAFAEDKVSIAKVDADAEKELGKRFGVRGYPTLKWFDGKSDEPEDYSGGRDLESLKKFVEEKIGVKAKEKVEEVSAVEMLTDASFKGEIGGEKGVLVAFTAPWCGHCKSLAPIWEQVARDFVNEPEVLIAKVDADSEGSKITAKEQGVTSYPTIKYFPKGSTEGVAYSGGRTEAAFIDFLNENAGTHRVVGGGLDDEAGLIPALNEIIATHAAAGTVPRAAAAVKKATEELKDELAPYYIRVLFRLQENSKYIRGELTRLGRILKNNTGLQAAKVDELKAKINILNHIQSLVGGDEKEEEVKEAAKEEVKEEQAKDEL